MALPHTMEEGGEGENLELQAAVPEDVQAVMAAAEDGDAEALSQALANLRSGVDCEGEDGDRPLHIACLYGHLSCVQILLAAGANMEVRDEDGGLPLHDACAGGYKEVVGTLLQAVTSEEQLSRVLDGFDIDGDTPNILTRPIPLVAIIFNSHDTWHEYAQYFCNAYAEPLHHAARGNHADVVQQLLDSGANPKISNLMGQFPADLADIDSPAQVKLLAAAQKLQT